MYDEAIDDADALIEFVDRFDELGYKLKAHA